MEYLLIKRPMRRHILAIHKKATRQAHKKKVPYSVVCADSKPSVSNSITINPHRPWHAAIWKEEGC